MFLLGWIIKCLPYAIGFFVGIKIYLWRVSKLEYSDNGDKLLIGGFSFLVFSVVSGIIVLLFLSLYNVSSVVENRLAKVETTKIAAISNGAVNSQGVHGIFILGTGQINSDTNNKETAYKYLASSSRGLEVMNISTETADHIYSRRRNNKP